MKIKLILGVVLLLAASAKLSSGGFPAGQRIDLSHDFSNETIYWVTSEPFKRETVAEGMTDQGFYYSAYNYSAAEHGGTHVEAPIHFAQGGKTVDAIPHEQLIAPAMKIDVSAKAASNRDYEISVEDLLGWEEENGRIPEQSIVLLQTGYGKFWGDRKNYLGTDRRGEEATAELHFPGLHPDAANWLVKNRKIKAIGLDTASIDYGQSQTFGSHVALMTGNIPAFENVANLDKVPVKGAHVIALPMKIKGGSGAPLRIIAFLPSQNG
jgi:kynurenine formamidase